MIWFPKINSGRTCTPLTNKKTQRSNLSAQGLQQLGAQSRRWRATVFGNKTRACAYVNSICALDASTESISSFNLLILLATFSET